MVGTPIFADAFGHDLFAGKQFALLHANQVVAGSPRGAAIALDEGMNPIHSPQGIGCDPGGMVNHGPIFMNDGKEAVHQVGHFAEMRRVVVADVNWFFAVASAELGEVGDRGMVKRPKGEFVEGFDAPLQADLDAVCQKVILPQEILVLNSGIERGIVFFAEGHGRGGAAGSVAGRDGGLRQQAYVLGCLPHALLGAL